MKDRYDCEKELDKDKAMIRKKIAEVVAYVSIFCAGICVGFLIKDLIL